MTISECFLGIQKRNKGTKERRSWERERDRLAGRKGPWSKGSVLGAAALIPWRTPG